jgi:microcystin-dependent protein
MDAYFGEIRIFAGNYPPQDWAFCEGQTLLVVQYQALYTVIGNTYGGTQNVNFMLPDLRGLIPVHQGTGAGLSPWTLNQQKGNTQVTLNYTNLPNHNHTISASTVTGDSNVPTDNFFSSRGKADLDFTNEAPNAQMKATIVGVVGGGQPVPIMQPFVPLRYIISLAGPVYPVKP